MNIPTDAETKSRIDWRYVIPNIVTVAAMLAGFSSILIVIQGIATEDANFFNLAARLIMLAMILDGLDGNLARWLGGQSEFGAELDTFVDMTAFGIAPAVLIFGVTTLGDEFSAPHMLLPTFLALSGVVRLARFKAKDPQRGQGGYTGLPITVSAGFVALFTFIMYTSQPDAASIKEGVVLNLFFIGIVVFSFLQVSNIRYPKPTKNAILFIPCLVLVTGFLLLGSETAILFAYLLIVLGAFYVFLGPLFGRLLLFAKSRDSSGI